MLAPIDKITSGGNDILQIEITRKCDLFNCSNCTRLLPFRKDPIEMDIRVFRQAVESVKDWPGIVALFGGNPCTHSQFPQVCEILASIIPPERRGLWTNHLREHGELSAQIFARGRLNLNAHGDADAYAEMDRWFPGRVIAKSQREGSWHSAILVDYRDLGITELEWIRAREHCDINRKWSGVIQQRDNKAVGYFCEVAGSIDGVTGERNGIEVYPGWWREGMPAFQHQVRNCCDKGCAIPLRLKGQMDDAAIYDASASWLPALRNRTGHVGLKMHHAVPEHCTETTDYVRLRS